MKLNNIQHNLLEYLLQKIEDECDNIHDVTELIEEALVDDELWLNLSSTNVIHVETMQCFLIEKDL